MSGETYTEVPDSIDTEWVNPVIDLYQQESEAIGILDELAVEYDIGVSDGSYSDSPLPSEIIYMLCGIDPVAIQTAAVRLHRTSEERFETLSDAKFEDLLEDSWSGDLADNFRDWVEGGGGYQGINVYFEDVRQKSEATALALLNLAERLKTTLDNLKVEFTDQLSGIEDVAGQNGYSLSSIWSAILSAGGIIGGVVTAVLSVSLAAVVGVVIGLISLAIFLWDLFRDTEDDIKGSITAMADFQGAVSGQAGGTGVDTGDLDQAEFEGADGDD